MLSKIKVAYVLPGSWGGHPHYTAELANAISKYAEVYVIKPEDPNDELFNENVNIIHGFRPVMFSRKEILKSTFSPTNIIGIGNPFFENGNFTFNLEIGPIFSIAKFSRYIFSPHITQISIFEFMV